jgi:hypothetical protein
MRSANPASLAGVTLSVLRKQKNRGLRRCGQWLLRSSHFCSRFIPDAGLRGPALTRFALPRATDAMPIRGSRSPILIPSNRPLARSLSLAPHLQWPGLEVDHRGSKTKRTLLNNSVKNIGRIWTLYDLNPRSVSPAFPPLLNKSEKTGQREK